MPPLYISIGIANVHCRLQNFVHLPFVNISFHKILHVLNLSLKFFKFLPNSWPKMKYFNYRDMWVIFCTKMFQLLHHIIVTQWNRQVSTLFTQNFLVSTFWCILSVFLLIRIGSVNISVKGSNKKKLFDNTLSCN